MTDRLAEGYRNNQRRFHELMGLNRVWTADEKEEMRDLEYWASAKIDAGESDPFWQENGFPRSVDFFNNSNFHDV